MDKWSLKKSIQNLHVKFISFNENFQSDRKFKTIEAMEKLKTMDSMNQILKLVETVINH